MSLAICINRCTFSVSWKVTFCLLLMCCFPGCGGDSTGTGRAKTAASNGVRMIKDTDDKVIGVKFYGPTVTDADIAVLADHPNLQSLTFMECFAVSDAGLASVDNQPDLKTLTIANVTFGDEGLLALASENLTSLTKLSLTNLPVTDTGMGFLKAIPNCEELELFGLAIEDQGLASMAELSAIRRLNLQSCGRVNGDGLGHLAALANLRELNLQGTILSTEGLEQLGHLSQLEHVRLDPANLTDDGLSQLTKLSGLKQLEIREVEITDAGLAHLAALQKLEVLDIDMCESITNEGLVHLAKLNSLKRLSLTGCPKLTADGMVHLEGMKGLELLSVIDSPVSDEAAKTLKTAIPQCTIFFGISPATGSI